MNWKKKSQPVTFIAFKTRSHFTACCERDPGSQAVHIHAFTSSKCNSPDRLQKSLAISLLLLCGTRTNPHILNPSVSQSFPGPLRWTVTVVINFKPIWMCVNACVFLCIPGSYVLVDIWYFLFNEGDLTFAKVADFKYQCQKRSLALNTACVFLSRHLFLIAGESYP